MQLTYSFSLPHISALHTFQPWCPPRHYDDAYDIVYDDAYDTVYDGKPGIRDGTGRVIRTYERF